MSWAEVGWFPERVDLDEERDEEEGDEIGMYV